MKYLKIKLLAISSYLMIFALFTSCDEPTEFDILNSYQPGTIAQISDLEPSFFDVFTLESATVNFTLKMKGEDASSVEVFKQFKDGQRISLGSFSTFPAEVSITASEAVEGTGKTLDQLQVGDVFTITFDITQADGMVTTSSTILPVNVACGSDLTGVYTTSTSGASTDSGPTPAENPISDFPYEVTLTESKVNGVYTISDFSGGVYELWYDIYGIAGDSPGTIKDVCNTISYTNTKEPFGTAVTGGGAFDPETGIITLSGSNGFGDTWSIVLTPKE